MWSFNKLTSLAVLSTLAGLTSASPLEKRVCKKYVDAASEAAANLQSKYFVNGGYPQDQQWVWISANDNFYLRMLDDVTGTKTYDGVVNTVFNGWEGQLDNGGSYDDLLWVVISYVRSGNLDQAKHYYDVAAAAKDSSMCGGGVFWSSKRDYKNAVTNELFIAASGYMYDATKDQTYLNNAKDTWAWLKKSDMKGSNGLFNDGLTQDCKNNGQTQWTYNQGVILVGLAYLNKHAGDTDAINDAWAIMDSVIANMAVDGGLREACEVANSNKCNVDQQSFKGITMMYFAWFLQITGKDNNGKYSTFIKQQGDKILANAVGAQGTYSNLWYAPNENSAVFTVQTQGSALGGLVAAAMQNC